MPIAIIPARAGSKRIKNKNIKLINGKPMISWVIKILKLSNIFDEIFVSTDSKEIAKISIKHGAKVPFLRKKSLSGDTVNTNRVISDFIKRLEFANDDYICCVYPTAILMQIKDIKKAFKKIKNNSLDYVFSATKHEKSVIRSFFFKKNKIKQILPKSYSYRTQDLLETYYDSGQFYWGTLKSWIKEKNIFNSNSDIILIPEERCQDIDIPEDLIAAKKKFNKYKEKF